MHTVILVRRSMKVFLPRTIATWNNLDIRDIDKINLAIFKAIIVICNHINVLPLEIIIISYNNYNSAGVRYNNNIIYISYLH